jgi:MFS family permease
MTTAMTAQTKQARSGYLVGRAATTAVGALISVAFMGSTVVTPLYVLYRQTFGFSEIVLTLIYAAYVVGNLAALLFFGRLSDSIGRRPVGLAAVALAGLAGFFFLSATGVAALFCGRIVSGLAVGLASATGTAWLAEISGGQDRASATLVATSANFLGVAIGPLIAGLLSQYAPAPLRLPHLVYILILLPVGVLIWKTRETVDGKGREVAVASLRPRLGVPAKVVGRFIAPATTAVAVFALVGFYAALIPSIMSETLHQTSRSLSGAVVCELFLVATVVMVATRRLASRTAMMSGLVLLLPSLALLVLAQGLGSLMTLLAGTAVSGLSSALGYRGGLQVVNEIAPADRRAEIVSSYFLACFFGNSVPVIGVGVLAMTAGFFTASLIFAAVIALLALFAIGIAMRFASGPRS